MDHFSWIVKLFFVQNKLIEKKKFQINIFLPIAKKRALTSLQDCLKKNRSARIIPKGTFRFSSTKRMAILDQNCILQRDNKYEESLKAHDFFSIYFRSPDYIYIVLKTTIKVEQDSSQKVKRAIETVHMTFNFYNRYIYIYAV